MQRQVLALAQAQRPDLHDPTLKLLAKAETSRTDLFQGPFKTLLPIMLEEQFGRPDLLMVFRAEDTPFMPQELSFIQGLGRMLALYLEEGRLHERYHQSFLSVSHRILATAAAKLPNLRAHSLNTAELSRGLARRLRLSSSQVEAVTISAILHDVGTLLLDLRILDKPVLTAEDLEQVQTHPILASTFLKDFHFPFDVLRIIRHHHERWDGKGYPDGIAGETIPVESRIINLVESFQRMTTGTAYRAAKSLPAAMAELHQLSGQQFDPRMVDEFIKLMENRH
jgi:HD-GYP domain-containing protein (c-di-GMP phosphodiesterase class II)